MGRKKESTDTRSEDFKSSSSHWLRLAGDDLTRSPEQLRRKTARGALHSLVGQGASFALRIGSMMVIARLVTPEQFGLVGMVTAFTGLLNLFRDGGLPQATVQRENLSESLTSTLFWLNLVLGLGLAAVTVFAAPFVAAFYGEPRLSLIAVALSIGFVLYGASAQHRALLERSMRFGTLVTIDIAALALSVCVGIGIAFFGGGYWALIGMTLSLISAGTIGVWAATRWVPTLPRRRTGVRSMLHYGSAIMANSFVVYVSYNADKVLLGRFWGAEVLGVYGRAYQLINIPTDSLHNAVGSVMFPALARAQSDAKRLRSYFLKGYSLFLSLVMPITIACGLFAADIVHVLLGSQWDQAIPVFRLLAPTILVFALINPMSYLMFATGRAVRSLQIALMIAPVTIMGYIIGLPNGAPGVAIGFSTAMLILVAPIVQWSKRGTLITVHDLIRAAIPPFLATLVGSFAAFGVGIFLANFDALLRLILVSSVLFGVHALTLIFVLGQKDNYIDMLRALRESRSSRSA